MITFFPSAFAPNRGANASAALLAGATVIASLAIATSEARAADDLIVKFDQTQLIRLARPIGEVIVGNPSIADVQVHSTNMLAVTGKGFGLTNVIVLDGDRNIIADQRIMVQRDEHRSVVVTRGTSRQTLNCSPQCNPTLTVGDELATMTALKTSMDLKNASAEKTGTDAQNGGNQ